MDLVDPSDFSWFYLSEVVALRGDRNRKPTEVRMARRKQTKAMEQLSLPLQPLLFPIPNDAVRKPYTAVPPAK